MGNEYIIAHFDQLRDAFFWARGFFQLGTMNPSRLLGAVTSRMPHPFSSSLKNERVAQHKTECEDCN